MTAPHAAPTEYMTLSIRVPNAIFLTFHDHTIDIRKPPINTPIKNAFDMKYVWTVTRNT